MGLNHLTLEDAQELSPKVRALFGALIAQEAYPHLEEFMQRSVEQGNIGVNLRADALEGDGGLFNNIGYHPKDLPYELNGVEKRCIVIALAEACKAASFEVKKSSGGYQVFW